MGAFTNNLVVKLLDDTAAGQWELIEPFSFRSDVIGKLITAPAGFQTDFCSVPRVPLAFDLLGNRCRRAGVIHDWLYTNHETSREQADEVLREMILANGATKEEAEIFYLGVREGGASHWGLDPSPENAR